MIDDFDLEELEELFAEFEIEAIADRIPDPGPTYDDKAENRKRTLMQHAAFYAENGPTWDPEGKYLCGSCYYRELPAACYIVEGDISMEAGSCQFYRYGNPESNPLPMKEKYTKEASNYAERPKKKGFGCYPRCEYGSVAEGADADGREIWCGQFGVHVRPKACCAFEDGEDLVQIESAGTSEGATKGWDTRGRGRKADPVVTHEHGWLLNTGEWRPVDTEHSWKAREWGLDKGSASVDRDPGVRALLNGHVRVGRQGNDTFFQLADLPESRELVRDAIENSVGLGHIHLELNDPETVRTSEPPYKAKYYKDLAPKDAVRILDGLQVSDVEKWHGRSVAAGGPGSGCDPEVAKEHGTECGPKAGEKKEEEKPVEAPKKDAAYYMKEKISEQKGSNPGGIYEGEDGVPRYVKLYEKNRQAQGEYLANEIYKGLHVAAPNSVLFKREGGKETIGNTLVEGKTIQQLGGITTSQAKEFMNGFAADVLTANWDAVGLGLDNILINEGPAHVYGTVLRLDQGGTLLTRAKGGEKPASALNSISEATKFFDKKVNADYAHVADMADVHSVADLGEKSGTNSLKAQVNVITSLRDSVGGWEKFVDDKIPDMPKEEKTKIVGMLEARTNLLQTLVLETTGGPLEGKPPWQFPPVPDVPLPAPKPATGKPPSKERDWSTPSAKLVGGFFRKGTVVAQVYTKLSQNEGQWQKISEIKKELEEKLGKPLYNISQNTLKQGGKKSGLWQVEISGNSIRMYVNKPGEKTTTVTEVSEDKQKIVEEYAAKFAKMDPMYGADAVYKSTVDAYLTKMGVPPQAQHLYQYAVSAWAGSPHQAQAQALRLVALSYYHREPSDEYVGTNDKHFDSPKIVKMAKDMEPAVMAMKALTGQVHVNAGTQYVYRNIRYKAAAQIAKEMKAAEAAGADAIQIPLNAISGFSTKSVGGYASGEVKIRMKVDPENIWSSYLTMPHEFVKGEREVLVGVHQPEETFSLKDISIEGDFAGIDFRKKYQKDFSKKDVLGAKEEKEKPLKVYRSGNIKPFDGDDHPPRKKEKEEEKKKK